MRIAVGQRCLLGLALAAASATTLARCTPGGAGDGGGDGGGGGAGQQPGGAGGGLGGSGGAGAAGHAGDAGAAGGGGAAGAGNASGGGTGGAGGSGGAGGHGGGGGASCPAGGTRISGILSTPSIWEPAGNPYIVEANTVVAYGAVLTLQPGAEIHFCPGVALEVEGAISAVGALDTPIVLYGATIRLSVPSFDTTYDAAGNYVTGPRFEHVKMADGVLHVVEYDTYVAPGPYMRDVELGVLTADFHGLVEGVFIDRCRIGSIINTYGFWVWPRRSWFRDSHIDSFLLDGYDCTGGLRIEHNEIHYLNIDRWRTGGVLEHNRLHEIDWNRPGVVTICSEGGALHVNEIGGGDADYALQVWNPSEQGVLDASANYWPGLTEELDAADADDNVSGIYDAHDDPGLAEVDTSGFLTSPPAGVGPSWALPD